MKIGILIPCYNRPQYLKQTLWSLERCELPEETVILLIDDASTDNETVELIKNFKINGTRVHYALESINRGIKHILQGGYESLFPWNCDLVINFDSDSVIRQDAVTKLVEAYIPQTILTGFHSTTKNADGSERHKIIQDDCFFKVTDKHGNDCGWVRPDLYFKQSVGGINFCVDKSAYENYLKPALNEPGNFDHNACIKAGGVYCLRKSVVQHIGFDSSLNHNEAPDVADDFYYWNLPNVTLLGVDNQPDRLIRAKDKCTKWIQFGDIQLLHPDIRSKEAYSAYVINEAWRNITTSHVLIFQHDGFVNNWMAWDNGWLQYDYIGAPWHYTDGHDVGNGGFSLRSRKLMEACSKIMDITHPEDHHICRTYRKQLEQMGFRFAPRDVAEKFSFEGYLQPTRILADQFGVHGRNPRRELAKPVRAEKYIFNQFLSLGDILFLVPMARALMAEGNTVMWPIDDKYFNISKHFPDINFVRKSEYNLPYEMRGRVSTPHGTMLPYRFASELMGRRLDRCMESKYNLYGHDHNMWRLLTWKRDYENEKLLIKHLQLPPKFVLVNRYYGHDAALQIHPTLPQHTPIIEMTSLAGFTLIDWLGVIELASEIHASNSSLNYLLELMQLKIPVYLYPRGIWGEVGFTYTRQLWTNKCFVFCE